MSCPRDRLVTYLDEYLGVDEWEEKSLNGLQVEGVAEVDRVALATDAALATFAMAVEAGAGFLIVHHGLFWGSVQAIVGPRRARIAALLDAGISLYAAHLPLDAHPGVGNNAVLARLLKLESLQPFGHWGTRSSAGGDNWAHPRTGPRLRPTWRPCSGRGRTSCPSEPTRSAAWRSCRGPPRTW